MLEVEIKAKINKEDVEKKLSMIGAAFVKEEKQIDTYFTHPCVDFKLKDEALRVREAGKRLFLAYKGAKVDLDTKTRDELEIEVKGKIFDLLKALGFNEVRRVIKKRGMYSWQGLKIFLDEVENLGDFVEVEAENMDEKDKIFSLLHRLGISVNSLTRKSYLELIMEK
ncbi:class IV adenylate cyclase [Candidatus Aerophobetes bacterium]|nr:class IV adenylate cyclase [Candidatus Aerophobetes bacterium]